MLTKEAVLARNNVNIVGAGSETLMLAHGFGCDQNMWQELIADLAANYRLVLFDYVGSGQSQLSAYSRSRYRSLEGYARDVTEICEALQLKDVHFVGHSVSATIGLIAADVAPEVFASHIMVCPSPCFLNDPPDYHGGFERADLEEFIELMDRNYIGWASYMAPLVLGAEGSDELVGELSSSFCSTDPLIAKTFALATFFSDYRHLLPRAGHPALLLQSQVDSLANQSVGKFMLDRMPQATLRTLPTEGHCIHMTHPKLVLKEIFAWLNPSGTV